MTLSELSSELERSVELGAMGAFIYIEDADGKSAFLTAGYADLKRKTRMRPDDYFHICSVTKSFTAAVILKLVAQRKLKLTDTVAEWLPEKKIPNANVLTLEHLLRMRSGLVDFESDPELDEGGLEAHRKPYSPEAAVDLALKHKARFKPDKKFEYCNTNFVLLELIAERVTGKLLRDLFQSYIIQPLALHTTRYPHWADLSLPEPYIRGYEWVNGSWLECSEVFMGCGDGAMLSSAIDLGKFFRALLTGQLLPKKLLEQMMTHVVDKPTADELYGLGLFIIETPVGTAWGHDGGGYGYSNSSFLHPESGRFVCGFVNGRSEQFNKQKNGIGELYRKAFGVELF
jgi:D-alanyl-D-alanine carboxypeptidase